MARLFMTHTVWKEIRKPRRKIKFGSEFPIPHFLNSLPAIFVINFSIRKIIKIVTSIAKKYKSGYFSTYGAINKLASFPCIFVTAKNETTSSKVKSKIRSVHDIFFE